MRAGGRKSRAKNDQKSDKKWKSKGNAGKGICETVSAGAEKRRSGDLEKLIKGGIFRDVAFTSEGILPHLRPGIKKEPRKTETLFAF